MKIFEYISVYIGKFNFYLNIFNKFTVLICAKVVVIYTFLKLIKSLRKSSYIFKSYEMAEFSAEQTVASGKELCIVEGKGIFSIKVHILV